MTQYSANLDRVFGLNIQQQTTIEPTDEIQRQWFFHSTLIFLQLNGLSILGVIFGQLAIQRLASLLVRADAFPTSCKAISGATDERSPKKLTLLQHFLLQQTGLAARYELSII